MPTRKKRKLRLWALLTVVFGALALITLAINAFVKPAPVQEGKEKAVANAELPEKSDVTEESEETADEPQEEEEPVIVADPFTDTDSLLILANKKHPLPDGYAPYDLREPNVASVYDSAPMRDEAATALEEMFAAAAEDGVTLLLGSGYRSQEYQYQLYSGYCDQYGCEIADTISSRPGFSDHQTGLAADIADHDRATYLTQEMEDTPEGIWLRNHAHEYGFIMRYPKGKDEITGYAYEPWHFRYVGRDYAEAIYNVDEFCSFEEYFGVEGGDYYE